jgi:Flp pilus assembly protein TadG
MRTSHHKTRNRGRRGNAILEAAMAMPMLMLMVVGVVDFGRAFYFSNIAAGAARAGTAYGAISSANFTNYTGMQAAAQADAVGVPNFSASASAFCQVAGTNVACATNPNSEGYVQVVTTISYPLIIGWPGEPNPLSIRGLSVLRTQ